MSFTALFEKLIFGGTYIRRGLSKTDWASLIAGRKFTVFPLFYFVFEGNFQVQPPGKGGRGYIWRGDLTEGLLRCEFGGLIFGGAYFRNFTVIYLIALVVIIAPYKMDVDPSLN